MTPLIVILFTTKEIPGCTTEAVNNAKKAL